MKTAISQENFRLTGARSEAEVRRNKTATAVGSIGRWGRIGDRFSYGLLGIGVSLFCLPMFLFPLGVRLNVSRSLPLGFYRQTKTLPVRGGLVFFCLPED